MNLKLKIAATLAGNTLEWLEFTLFAYLSHKIAPHFFSADTASVATVKTYMLFGSSYLARPFGALFFGALGDKWGRVLALKNSLLLMSLATVSMALIPSYERVGLFSPVLLAVCRLLQGFSVSGEFNSSILILIEYFGKDRPFSFGVLGPLSASLGMLLGALLSSLVYTGFLPEDSWRLVFLLSSLLGFLAYYLRRTLVESRAFLKAKQEKRLKKHPILEVFRNHKKAFLLCFFCAMFIANFVYLGSFFYEKLAQQAGFFSPKKIHKAIVWGQGFASLIMFLGFFIFKKYSFSPKKIVLISLSLPCFLSPLMMKLSMSSDFFSLLLGQSLYGLMNGLASSVLLTYVSLEFPPETRLSGSSLSWSLGAALFGGTSLLIGEALRIRDQTDLIGFYLSFSAFLPLLFTLFQKDR